MRTIAISNYEGGVGKTTTAVKLAAIFAARGLRTLPVDLDPQASATDFFGLYNRVASERRTSVELPYGGALVEEVAYAAGENLDVATSIIDLVAQNEILLREQRLKFAPDDASGSYDVCLIDRSPMDAQARIQHLPRRHGGRRGRHPSEARLHRDARHGAHRRGNALHRRRAAHAHATLEDSPHLRARPHGQQRQGHGRGRARRLLPERAVRDGHPREQQGLRGQLAVEADGATFEPGSRPTRDYEALADEVSRELA